MFFFLLLFFSFAASAAPLQRVCVCAMLFLIRSHIYTRRRLAHTMYVR